MKNPLDHKGVPARNSDRMPGAAPGILVAPDESPPPVMDVVLSGNGQWERHENVGMKELVSLWEHRGDRWLWLDVNGLGDPGLIAQIGAFFRFHRLSLEDAMNLHQRPKTERYDSYQFMVLQQPYLCNGELDFEQVSVFLADGLVVTLQAYRETRLGPLLERLRRGAPRLTSSRTDYLAYSVLDALVDQVFPVIEHFDDRIEALEERLLGRRTSGIIAAVHALRGEIMVLRRVLWNQTRMLEDLQEIDGFLVQPDTHPYLRDVLDHSIRAHGLVEQQRDSCSALFELHNSVNTAQLNEVMKVLTIISTIFIPLTFIVGIYGMNFNPEASPYNMPELNWRYGYPFAWLVMAASAVGMLWMFRRRGWIGGGS